MTAVTGAGRPPTRKAALADQTGSGFGLGPGRAPNPASATAGPHPGLRFTALDGLRGLAVPFVLAFALRSDIARLHAPVDVQYLADGGYVLVTLFFVLAGFLLCRPLGAVLAGSKAEAAAVGTGLARRIAPLHLVAWAITFGWLVTGTSPSSSAGTVWSWLSSALLLNGVAGPERTGYPVSWSVSVALCGVALLMVTAFALASLSGRTRRKSQDFARPGSILPAFDSGPLVTGIAWTAALIGAGLLLFTAPEVASTTGPAAIGQALLGLGAGLLSFRVLEGATGTLKPPLPRTAPAAHPAPGLGSLLALAALLFCVYRSDLMHELKLLPVFPIAAALVYFLALPHATGRSPVNRVLDSRLLQWLGTRALGLYLLHGPVQLTVDRVCELRGLDRESTPVAYGVLAGVVLGSLITAELGYRLLERRLAASVPAPAPTSMYRRPHSRPERISLIDQNAIPNELRLRPLPRKATLGDPVAEAAAQSSGAPTETPTDAPTATPAKRPRTRPIDVAAAESAAKPLTGKAVRKTAEKVAEVPAEAASTTPARKSVRKPADKPIAKATAKPAAKSIELPADKPTGTSVELPADKPARKTAARKPVAKTADKPIDLDRPTAKPGSEDRVLDADAKTLDADSQP